MHWLDWPWPVGMSAGQLILHTNRPDWLLDSVEYVDLILIFRYLFFLRKMVSKTFRDLVTN